jgi:hypothetical protein
VTTTVQVRCDSCGTTVPGGDLPERWGRLAIRDQGERDICATCIAKLTGWNVPRPLKRVGHHVEFA